MALKLWWYVFLLFNALVVYGDMRRRRVPNKLLVSFLVLAAIWHGIATWLAPMALPPVSWLESILGFVLGLAFILLWLWRCTVMGAGDVKYFAVLGFIMGWRGLALALAFGSLLGLIHVVGMLWMRIVRRAETRGQPYAAYVALGALIAAYTLWNLP